MKHLKPLIFSTLIAVLSSNAWAADSTWYLCDNGSLAVNLSEHRASNGVDRAFTVAIMYGANVVLGEAIAQDNVVYKAKFMTGANSFAGQISLGNEGPGPYVLIDGTLTLSKNAIQENQIILPCKVMNN